MKTFIFKPNTLQSSQGFVTDSHSGLQYFGTKHRVLYGDTDCSGVVYHANYFRYFELGRTSLMRALGAPYADIEKSGIIYPIIKAQVEYLDALVYDQEFIIYVRPDEKDRIRGQFQYVLYDQSSKAIICLGSTQHCAVNQARKPVAIDALTKKVWDNFPGS